MFAIRNESRQQKWGEGAVSQMTHTALLVIKNKDINSTAITISPSTRIHGFKEYSRSKISYYPQYQYHVFPWSTLPTTYIYVPHMTPVIANAEREPNSTGVRSADVDAVSKSSGLGPGCPGHACHFCPQPTSCRAKLDVLSQKERELSSARCGLKIQPAWPA